MTKSRLLFVAVLGAAALVARPPAASAAACGNYVHIVPDGRVNGPTMVDNTFDLRVTFWAVGGHSYSIEINEYDYADNVTTIFGDAGDLCPTTDMAGLTHTEGTDPFIVSVTAQRASFTEPGSGVNFHVARVAVAAGSHPVTFSISDTTVYSPAWSTFGSYDTFYSLFNTTRTTCSGTLTLYNTSGTVVTSVPVTVPAGSTTATNTAAMATARNTSGTAKFTHNCPPGAFLAEAAIANFTITPTPYFQFVHFQPTRESGR